MQEQNFQNHIRLVHIFNFGVYGISLSIIILSVIKFYRSYQTGITGLLVPLILFMVGIVLILLGIYARHFALVAQDRAIRAEENLRYFAITGKLLDSKLTMKQIIALRFAPNNELLELSHKAVAENLSQKEIKKLIQHWKGDHHRV